jgi:hypothetical protein
MKDDRVCPVCQALEGFTWTFEAGKKQLSGSLVHPSLGVVWDMTSGSQAHGHRGNCRCNITYIVSLSDLVERIKTIRTMLLEMIPEGGK